MISPKLKPKNDYSEMSEAHLELIKGVVELLTLPLDIGDEMEVTAKRAAWNQALITLMEHFQSKIQYK